MALIIRNFRKNLLNAFTVIGKENGRYSSDTKLNVNTIFKIIPRRYCYGAYVNFSKSITSKHFNLDSGDNGNSSRDFLYGMTFIPAGILSIFGKKEEPEESELITTIKRGVLLIERGEFKKAEQMLHLALKMAQEQQNEEGITYIYDLLANLALEQKEYNKAETLFVSVMQRLVSQGVPQTDNRIIHMSLKLANIFMIQKNESKAETELKKCIEALKHKEEMNDLEYVLYVVAVNMYTWLLLDLNRHSEAFDYFKEIYDMNVKLRGENNEESVIILNNLATICFIQQNYDEAIAYLKKAMEIGDNLPDMKEFGFVLTNLIAVYIKKGNIEDAKKICQKAWAYATTHKNEEVLNSIAAFCDEMGDIENGKP